VLLSRVVEQWLSSRVREIQVSGNSALIIKRRFSVFPDWRPNCVWGGAEVGNARPVFPGRTFGGGCCEHRGSGVVVAIDFGGGFAGIGPQNSSGVMGRSSL